MAKKKIIAPPLSPEKYIRQRVRGVPLHQCLINGGWEEQGVANIVISRKHINGNITLCFYLVDLFCVGIKETFFRFNISELVYEEKMEDMRNEIMAEEVDYALVHNILYTAWSYGEELEFEQHKDFLSTTRYMLEEDTDEIPLIEIKCGLNGKPCYVQGSLDSDTKVRRILNHLEKKVGKGNYDFIISADSDYSENNDNWDDVE